MIIPAINLIKARSRRGFTLVEVVVSLGVLMAVLAIVCEQIASMQKMSASEAAKLDITQQTREFLNQTARDLHMSGYPAPSMFTCDPGTSPCSGSQPALNNPYVAAGLVSVSPTQIIMEGDVNGDGQVYSVAFTFVAADPNDPNCPCVRRAAIAKSAAFPWAQPAAGPSSYTEATHLVPPGTGPAQSGQDIFEFLDRTGNPVDISSGNTADPSAGSGQGPANLAKIAAIKINLTLTTPQKDPVTGQPVTVALSALARPRQ
jgi:type II secretory pathway pseudopilin PulG